MIGHLFAMTIKKICTTHPLEIIGTMITADLQALRLLGATKILLAIGLYPDLFILVYGPYMCFPGGALKVHRLLGLFMILGILLQGALATLATMSHLLLVLLPVEIPETIRRRVGKPHLTTQATGDYDGLPVINPAEYDKNSHEAPLFSVSLCSGGVFNICPHPKFPAYCLTLNNPSNSDI